VLLELTSQPLKRRTGTFVEEEADQVPVPVHPRHDVGKAVTVDARLGEGVREYLSLSADATICRGDLTSRAKHTPTQATAASGAAWTALSMSPFTILTVRSPSPIVCLAATSFSVRCSPTWMSRPIWCHRSVGWISFSIVAGLVSPSFWSWADRNLSYARTMVGSSFINPSYACFQSRP
jgi:hypothetical protein